MSNHITDTLNYIVSEHFCFEVSLDFFITLYLTGMTIALLRLHLLIMNVITANRNVNALVNRKNEQHSQKDDVEDIVLVTTITRVTIWCKLQIRKHDQQYCPMGILKRHHISVYYHKCNHMQDDRKHRIIPGICTSFRILRSQMHVMALTKTFWNVMDMWMGWTQTTHRCFIYL